MLSAWRPIGQPLPPPQATTYQLLRRCRSWRRPPWRERRTVRTPPTPPPFTVRSKGGHVVLLAWTGRAGLTQTYRKASFVHPRPPTFARQRWAAGHASVRTLGAAAEGGDVGGSDRSQGGAGGGPGVCGREGGPELFQLCHSFPPTVCPFAISPLQPALLHPPRKGGRRAARRSSSRAEPSPAASSP